MCLKMTKTHSCQLTVTWGIPEMTQQTEHNALRKLAEAATPGPWAFGTFHRLLVVQADKHGGADKHSAIADIGAGSIPWDATAESMQEYNDAEYIAAANPAAVITLLDQLQSQAERIKELESEVEMWKATANAVVDFEKVQLRAEIAAIAATEPSMIYHGRCVIDCGDSGHHDVTMLKMIARETKLFTRPMPAQDVTELVEALEMAVKLNSFREFNDHIPAMRDALSKYKGAK